MKKLTLVTGVLLALSAPNVTAATWYVRTDGGPYGTDSTHCNGQTDAAFTGSNGPSCAVNHPFEVLGINAGTPRVQRIAGGDTVIIKNGSYRMGATAGVYDSGSCHSAWPYDCYNFAIPSGPDSSNKTKIYGENYASCGAGVTKPELWGAGRTSYVLNLDGTSNTDIQCLDITDHDDCGGFDSTFACPPYSSSVTYGRRGLYYYNGSNNSLTNVKVHGLELTGIMAGKQTNFSAADVDVLGNGFSGFDQDTPNADDSWSGTNTFTRVKINWNGCSESYPADGTYIGCTDENNSGYGDGWGSPDGGTAGSFTFTGGEFRFNTSDGLDLLYNSDPTATITVDRVLFEGDKGNSIKVGDGKVIVRNSAIIANCGFWDDFPSKGSAFSPCRAGGNAIVLNLGGAGVADIVNSTIVGEPDILLDIAGCNGGEILNIQNNILVGTTQYGGGDVTSWAYAYSGCVYGTLITTSTAKNNIIYGVKESSPCSGQTSCSTSNPTLTSTNFTTEAFDLRLRSGSPAIDAGLDSGTTVGNTTVPTVDILNAARPANDVDIGAYEYAASSGPVMSTCSLPAGTVGVAYDQTISVTGGTTPYTACDETSGSLPAGSPAFTSTPTASGCRIQGTPTGAGANSFTERVTDTAALTDSEACSLTINASAPTITTTTLLNGYVSYPYTEQIYCSGGTSPYTFSEVGANLGTGACTGVSLSSSGALTAPNPTVAGTCSFTARCTDNAAQTDDQALSFQFAAATLQMYLPQIEPLDTTVRVFYGAAKLPYESDCTVQLQNSGGTQIDSTTTTEGFSTREAQFSGLTASTAYRFVLSCQGASPADISPSSFTTRPTPSVGNRSFVISLGEHFLTKVARVTVDYGTTTAVADGSVQNTSCASGCNVTLTIPAGVRYYRVRWQDAADVVLATGVAQRILVE